MARLFPFRPGGTEVSQEPRLVNLDDGSADDVFSALSSDTARAILTELYEEPTTASEVADAVDTSLQNARYHIDKLQDAGLVEQVDTWYSSRGTEMTVYAPTNEPLVVAAGREESTGILRDALQRVLGAVGVLGVASLVVDRLAGRSELAPDLSLTGGADGDDAAPTGDADATYDAGGPATDTGMPQATGTPVEENDAGAMDTTGTESIGTDTPTDVATEAPTAAETRTAAPESTVDVTATAAEQAREATATVADQATEVAMADGGGFQGAVAALPPGALFFAGGLLMIALGVGWWYASAYRGRYA